jgi:hypothetical protein
MAIINGIISPMSAGIEAIIKKYRNIGKLIIIEIRTK